MRPFIESWPCYNESCSHIDGVIPCLLRIPPLSRLPKYAPALNLICLGFVSLSGQVASKKPELQRKIQLGWPLWGACLRGRRSPLGRDVVAQRRIAGFPTKADTHPRRIGRFGFSGHRLGLAIPRPATDDHNLMTLAITSSGQAWAWA